MKTCVFIAVVVVVGLSGGRFPDEKACCLSRKTREKNVCRGRMIGLSTELARVKEVDRVKRKVTGSHRKCVNRACAQSVDCCKNRDPRRCPKGSRPQLRTRLTFCPWNNNRPFPSSLVPLFQNESKCENQAPVVQRLDNAIHRINRYPADKC